MLFKSKDVFSGICMTCNMKLLFSQNCKRITTFITLIPHSSLTSSLVFDRFGQLMLTTWQGNTNELLLGAETDPRLSVLTKVPDKNAFKTAVKGSS